MARKSAKLSNPVYPRVGGGNRPHFSGKITSRGLSPRGRGKRAVEVAHRVAQGSIPAWAGETRPIASCRASAAVYPRVGGGNRREVGKRAFGEGLSPRGRGKLRILPGWPIDPRSIPAWAGETAPGCWLPPIKPGLSPRGRGKRRVISYGRLSGRSIPAWAGETSRYASISGLSQVYPRVGGGNRGLQSGAAAVKGLSPRGRGKPASRSAHRPSTRSIPAWAGETYYAIRQGTSGPVYPRVGGGNLAGRQ